MKVFISWSGNISEKIATILSDWLPDVLPEIEPWMSKQDVMHGENWPIVLSKELAEIDYGILCLTSENLNAPWILFEAGALSKNFEKSRVMPLVYDVEINEIPSPLSFLQAKTLEQAGIWDMVKALNSLSSKPKTDTRLKRAFDTWWPDLEQRLNAEINEMLHKLSYKFYAERFGVGHRQVTFECRIDDKGGAEASRTVRVDAFSEIQFLDTILLFDHNGPNGNTDERFEGVEITSIDTNRSRKIRHEQRILDNQPGVAHNILFDPPLQRNDTSGYIMKEKGHGFFRLGSIGEREEREFFGWSTERPTQLLELIVIFPEGQYPGQARTEVSRTSCSGGRENPPKRNEMKRVGDPQTAKLEDGRFALKLSINYPVHGLVYKMTWDPETAI